MNLSKRLRKYLVMGSQNCDRDPVGILEEAITAGITAFQYREKGSGSLTGKEKLELGLQLREVCRQHGVLFIVNDDSSLVDPLEADGIHVGQEDSTVEQLRARFPDRIIGLSVSTAEEVDKSPVDQVDYLGAGPMFPTSTKEDAKPVVGPEWVKRLKESYPKLPIVGIGGITADNSYSVIEAGADGVAVISAITKAENINEVIERL